jgi:hypothetical protein
MGNKHNCSNQTIVFFSILLLSQERSLKTLSPELTLTLIPSSYLIKLEREREGKNIITQKKISILLPLLFLFQENTLKL